MNTLEYCVVEFDLQHRSLRELSIDELERIDLQHTEKIYWIHSNLNQAEIHQRLIKKCHLPENVVVLCNQADVIPQALDTEDSLTIHIQALMSTEVPLKNKIDFGSLIFYLTPTFCFTATSDALPMVSDFKESVKKSLRYAKTPCFILFLMLDIIINDYAKMLFNFDDVADHMDLRVRKARKNIYKDVIKVKQYLMKVKRSMIALREILTRISGRNISVISSECRLSLSKLSNHAHLVVHEVDSVRDLLNSLLDQIENNLMQNLNQSIRILTAFSTIFLPLSLIAGIYGMNFNWVPELHWKFGYFYALSLMVLCAGIILYVFKKMKWF